MTKKKLTMARARKVPATHVCEIGTAALGQDAEHIVRAPHPLTEQVLKKQEEILALVRALSEMGRHPARELRPFKCTQADFDLLPGLVSKGVFCYWTGFSDEELYGAVKEGRIKIYKPRANGKSLYYKHEIARMTGFRI